MGWGEAWACQISVWSTARPGAVDAFAAGVAALGRDREQQRPSATHLGPLADAAGNWSQYRSGEKSRAAAEFAPRGTGVRTVT